MGYYTYYSLDVLTSDGISEHPDKNDIIEALRNSESYIHSVFDEDGSAQDKFKWYEHDEDMLALSKLYPDAVFELSGEGENGSDDLWIKYYRNGQYQVCPGRVEYDAYDPTKLQTI